MTDELPAERLGRLIRERRNELKLTQADIQESGGPSTATLRLIENGEHTAFRRSTSEPLERILRWARGSVDAILAGGDPAPDYSGPRAPAAGLRSVSDGALIAELVDRLAQRHRVIPVANQLQDDADISGWLPPPEDPGVLGPEDGQQRHNRRS